MVLATPAVALKTPADSHMCVDRSEGRNREKQRERAGRAKKDGCGGAGGRRLGGGGAVGESVCGVGGQCHNQSAPLH